ncbi:MAG: hypothetical protein KatS3mg109_2040 [Pirellulaceae bacterium]|nr:MAG: hypothetical protein KatS3mg109_2040 [Pirellulaceae bacterium]
MITERSLRACKVLAALMFCGGVWAPIERAEGATIYVRTSGNDANVGDSPAAALRTISRAAALARPGDRIVVGPGRYNEGDIQPAAWGRVSFIADRRGIEVGEPPGDVVIAATGFSNGFLLNSKIRVKISGFVIYGAGTGIYVKSGSDQAAITDNIITGNQGRGIYVQDSNGVLVFNNLVYANGSTGILIGGNTTGSRFAKIVNNTVYRNGNRGIFFAGTDIGSSDGLVLNNIATGNVTATNPNLLVGIQVNPTSRTGYLSAGNVIDRVPTGTPARRHRHPRRPSVRRPRRSRPKTWGGELRGRQFSPQPAGRGAGIGQPGS